MPGSGCEIVYMVGQESNKNVNQTELISTYDIAYMQNDRHVKTAREYLWKLGVYRKNNILRN